MATTIKINGVDQTVDVDGDTPLLWVLRDVLGMTGTKFGCGMALCGACTVHVDGVATRSCITTVDSIGTSEITTIEAIGATRSGRQDPEGLARPGGGSVSRCLVKRTRHGAAGRSEDGHRPCFGAYPAVSCKDAAPGGGARGRGIYASDASLRSDSRIAI
jgi:hypothetical protein